MNYNKYLIFVVCFIFLCKISFTQNNNSIKLEGNIKNNIQFLNGTVQNLYEINDTNNLKIDTLKQIFNEDTFDLYNYYSYGKLIRTSRYLMGDINAVDNFKEDKAHGDGYLFHKNGKLSKHTVYNMGKLVSWIDIYEDGTLKGVGINDSITGINSSKEYYNTGELKETQITNLKTNGYTLIKTYHKNSKICSDIKLGAGKQRAITYNEQGVIVEDYSFIDLNFNFVGECKLYYWDTGVLKEHKFYKEGDNMKESNIKTGTWKYYSEKGELIKEEKYKNGELIDTKEYMPLNLKKNN